MRAGKRGPTLIVQAWGMSGRFHFQAGDWSWPVEEVERTVPRQEKNVWRSQGRESLGSTRDRKDVLAIPREVGPNHTGPQ